MKGLHLPVTGHDLLAVERFQRKDCALGARDQYIRRFLTEEGYTQVLEAQKKGHIRVCKSAAVIEGHIVPDKKKKRRRK